MQEIWKDIAGYEGLYQVSNCGRVKSLNYNHTKTDKVLCEKHHKSNYVTVVLCKNGVNKNKSIHILVASAFIANPNNYPCVNHKNGIKTDNRLENLEWTTKKENTRHAYNNNLGNFKNNVNEGIKKMNYYSEYVQVILIDLTGKEYYFNSTIEAAKFAKTNNNEISRAIRKEQRVKGYKAFGIKRQRANGET
jgi:hypothetical protein